MIIQHVCQTTVRSMLADIQARGEEAALEWAEKLDGELDQDSGDAGDDKHSKTLVMRVMLNIQT